MFVHISLPQLYHTADLKKLPVYISRWETYTEVNVFVNNNVTYDESFSWEFFFQTETWGSFLYWAAPLSRVPSRWREK